MKIESCNIRSQSAHKLEKREERSEKFSMWSDNGMADNSTQEQPYVLDINGIKNSGPRFQYTVEKTYLTADRRAEADENQEHDAKLMLIESFVYMLAGKRIKLKSPKLESDGNGAGAEASINDVLGATQHREGWGLVYEYHEIYAEAEHINFSSAGSITLEDGRSIMFDVQFSMSRQFYSENRINIRLGDAAVDPLMIDLAGNGPGLTPQKYTFDLNADGVADSISFAAPGSGFLTLDKNGDGIINDGTELFGPQTGNGFEELRAYDVDNNGWIDESDPIFNMLSVLAVTRDGDRTLFRLGEAGVGAIYLHQIETPYEFRDQATLNGELKSSSIYIKEDGKPGTIHHVNLTI